ncbi:MAG TPA: hypothetical protein VEA40_26115 [Ramlibacter sp.]|nr:hypothetical protein [Ramlibacter sp.]
MDPLPRHEAPPWWAQDQHPNIGPAEEGAEPLAAWLERAGGLPLFQGLALATQLLSALEFLHRHGEAHGDVHERNLRVTRSGRLVLSASDALPPSAQRDLRAAAAVAQRLLGSSATERPPELDAVLRRALSDEPHARFGSAEELSAALQQALGQPRWQRFSTAVGAPAQRGTGRRREHRPGLRRMGLVLAGVCAALAVWTFGWRGTVEPARLAAAPAAEPIALAPSRSLEPVRPDIAVGPAAPVEPLALLAPAAEQEANEPVPWVAPLRAAPLETMPVRHLPPPPPARAAQPRRVAASLPRPTPSPLQVCGDNLPLVRQMCLAWRCSTDEFRRHSVCVRLLAEQRLRDLDFAQRETRTGY